MKTAEIEIVIYAFVGKDYEDMGRISPFGKMKTRYVRPDLLTIRFLDIPDGMEYVVPEDMYVDQIVMIVDGKTSVNMNMAGVEVKESNVIRLEGPFEIHVD